MKKTNPKGRVPFGTLLDPKLHERLRRHCDQKDLLMYAVVEKYIRDGLDMEQSVVDHGR